MDQHHEPADAGQREEPDQPAEGLRCPDCGCPHLPVQATRRRAGWIRRYRRCRHCGRRVITSERLAGQRPAGD